MGEPIEEGTAGAGLPARRRMRTSSRRGSPSMLLVVGAIAVVAIFAIPAQEIGVPLPVGSSAISPDRLPVGYQFRTHIQHIVVLMEENHAYDNYFATYCTAKGKFCTHVAAGEPAGLCIPLDPNNTKAGCVKPFPFTPVNWTLNSQLPHGWTAANGDYQNGSMDGWYPSEYSGLDPFGYYNGTTVPLYWDLAEEYGLGDQFFSSTLGYSLPNHWHLVAGTSPNESVAHLFGVNRSVLKKANDSLYLSQANKTRSAEDLLLNSTVSWTWYDHVLGSYSRAILDTSTKIGNAYSYYNPQAAKAESYNASFYPHFVNNSQFFVDARNGALPSLSWVIPTIAESDHPPSNVTAAETFVASVVDAVESSPEWNSTALFVTWDDFGGFYDQFAPHSLVGTQTNNLTGFRVPFIVISPYSKLNYVSHDFGYFESLLHLMEWRFNLGCLRPLDCNAPIPFDYFNFSQSPRAPILFPTNLSQWSYPLKLQAPATALPRPQGAYYPPNAFLEFTGAAMAEADD